GAGCSGASDSSRRGPEIGRGFVPNCVFLCSLKGSRNVKRDSTGEEIVLRDRIEGATSLCGSAEWIQGKERGVERVSRSDQEHVVGCLGGGSRYGGVERVAGVGIDGLAAGIERLGLCVEQRCRDAVVSGEIKKRHVEFRGPVVFDRGCISGAAVGCRIE